MFLFVRGEVALTGSDTQTQWEKISLFCCVPSNVFDLNVSEVVRGVPVRYRLDQPSR